MVMCNNSLCEIKLFCLPSPLSPVSFAIRIETLMCVSTPNIHILPICLWSYCVQPFTLLSPSSLLTPSLPSLPSYNQPSMSKNKDLNRSTKGPPVLLAWWLCFGESFLFLHAQAVKSESTKRANWRRVNKPAHYPCQESLDTGHVQPRYHLHNLRMFLT